MISPNTNCVPPITDVNYTQVFQNLISSVVQAQKTTFSLEEAAAYLHIPIESILYYSKRIRELSFVPLGKGNLVFLKSDLDDFLTTKRVQGIAA